MPLHLPEGHPVRVRGWVGKDVTDEIGEWLLDVEVRGADGLPIMARFAEKCFDVPFVLLLTQLDLEHQEPVLKFNVRTRELKDASRRSAQRILAEMGLKIEARDLADLARMSYD